MSATDSSITNSPSNTCSFIVDRDQIPQTEATEVRGMPNVLAYDQTELEAGVLRQAVSAFNTHTEREITKTQQRLQCIDQDIKFANDELENMEKELDGMLKVSTANSRKLRNLELETENKMRHIDTLKARRQSLVSKLSRLQFSREENGFAGCINTVSTTEERKVPCVSVSKPSTSYNSEDKSAATSARQPLRMPTPKQTQQNAKRLLAAARRLHRERHMDDASTEQFLSRLRRKRKLEVLQCEMARENDEPLTTAPDDGVLDANFRVPSRIWSRLFDYQRAGVNWLWSMHMKRSGGILGDEMGLGKTIQVIAFLAGLHYSDYYLKRQSSFGDDRDAASPLSILIVCPATVLQQWMREFYEWYPAIRIIILHSTGSGYRKPAALVRTAMHHPGTVLLTTYNTLVAYQDLLTAPNTSWTYIILDEGHKIKNPEAEITSAVKRFATPHRLILSGSPVQNNLRELWSVFDFVCPGRLGPLADFMQQFSIPITQGGYASASPLQVETAYRCACTLRDLLMPYLLRRLKSDVRIQLPSKSEQVLFCRLTGYQRQLYEEFTESQLCKDLLNGKGNVFEALILLRKLCNHPDLVTGGPRDRFESAEATSAAEAGDLDPACLQRFSWTRFGCPLRSSKMIVVSSLLRSWSAQGHKVLLFSQSRRMLTLLERLIVTLGLSYLRMDGSTPVGQRASLIEQFSRPTEPGYSSVNVFLLTTRVGGLGINLTAASRVLIYDPDWNPTTDLQARERAWRIGQTQNVVIYRLLTCGTIEEKIYHRQIFKQFLTNRVLKNPRQQRFFKTNDLYELLSFDDSLSADGDRGNHSSRLSETASYVKSEGFGHIVRRNIVGKDRPNRFDLLLKEKLSQKTHSTNKNPVDDGDEGLQARQSRTCDSNVQQFAQPLDPSKDREKRLRLLARELSRRIAEGRLGQSSSPCTEEPRIKTHRTHKHNKGTRVDGRRIALVARRSTYDTGESGKASKSRSPKRPRTTALDLPDTSKEGAQKDVFLSVLLSRPGTADDPNACALPSGSDGRRAIDPETQEEAARIAANALKAIQCLSHASLNGSGVADVTTSAKRPTASYSIIESRSTPPKISKRSDTKSSKSSQQLSVNRPVLDTARSLSQSADPLTRLSHVSHILQHDSLIEMLTHQDRIDPSFRDTEVRRLVTNSVDALVNEAKRGPRATSFQPSIPAQFIIDTGVSRDLPLNLASVKNRYLWNPKEETSNTFLYLTNSLMRSSLSSTSENTFRFDPDILTTGDASHLFTGHVRFSSTLLLQLIRTRCSVRQSGAGSANSSIISSLASLNMQRLCSELIRLLSGTTLVTSTVLATNFRSILSRTTSTADDSELDARHFRALLRCVAERRRASGSSLVERHRINDVWTLKDNYREVARYLSTQLALCER
ncbi:unnamed protein product [Dicrocoelium dendriticum]|nr:unnamed protein product [Dicrocoelium dendriticum]